MWNMLDLKCPTEDMCMYGERDADLIIEMSNLATLLTSSAESLTQESPVWEEIKIFHNVQAKYKQMLHCDKCLVLLQRVGGCLRKMVILNLSKTLLDFGEQVINGLQKKSRQTHFPSKQQLEFVLLRCQSAAKLVLEALHYSREAFYYLVQKLNVGHLVLHLIMAVSVTARVNILFKGVLVNLFSIYRKLYPWLDKLKSGNHEWPQDLNLPDDLEMWLKPEECQLLRPKHLPQERLDFLTSFFFKKDDEVPPEKKDDEVIKVDSDEDCIIECGKNGSIESSDIEDLGEVISRVEEGGKEEEECELVDSPNQKLTSKQTMLVKKITSAKNLKRIRIIWNHLNVSNPDLLPKALTPGEIRIVEKMLMKSKKEMRELKLLKLPKKEKQKKKRTIIRQAAKKLIKHLGLNKHTVPTNSPVLHVPLQPVSTFVELRQLYGTLYDLLQSQQMYDKCNELEKVFKSRKEDIKLLKARNEKFVIQNLIFCTSKVLLALYEK